MPLPFAGKESFAGASINEAEGSLLLSTCSVFSESTKYMFVSLVSIKGKNPPVLPLEKFFSSDCSQKESWGELFFFSWVVWSTLCLSWKQNWELKESTPEEKNKDAFHHSANQKQRYGLSFFSSYPITPGNVWSPDSIGKRKSDFILIGHLS